MRVSKYRQMKEAQASWYAGYEEVYTFGSLLLDGGRFFGAEGIDGEADNLLAYFEKPWHWDRVHAWWVANDRPTELLDDGWDTAEANDWEIDL